MGRFERIAVVAMLAACGVSSVTVAEEIKDVVARLTALPQLKAESGFAATVLVAPGQLYDPLIMLPTGKVMWLNDDGGEEGDKGSRLLAVDTTGAVSVLAGIGKLLPTVGFDLAPKEFGAYAGQIFTLAQPKVAAEGALTNHVIQRLEPAHDFAVTTFCTLPDAGPKKIPGYGLDARFGPSGSPFAGRLFAITIYNDAIYQITPDGKCTPFVVLDGKRYSAPTMMLFSADGQRMLVAVSAGAWDITGLGPQRGAILRIAADGTIDDLPVWSGVGRPMGMDYAPPGFGDYAGQLFFSDVGLYQIPVPMTQALLADGKIYRLDKNGKAVLVASGFHNPNALRFFKGKLWVSDINGDFIAGKRELPDGFIGQLEVRK